MERLQKVIASSGLTSRRKAEELIKEGHVKVNGNLITELGTKVKESDKIEVDNKLLTKENKVYYLLNKPREVLATTTDDKNRKTIIDLIDEDKRIYPVGRLDYDTTGAIILTNDGELSNIITHPNNNVEKVYIAKLNKILIKDDIIKLKRGVKLDNKLIIPKNIKVKKINKDNSTCIVEIIVHDGINHEVKRLFESIGYDVLKLKRERIAMLTLDGLSSGKYRKITPKEVKVLYSLKK
ncbi:MAG: rRNA pseudouridine synthase [Bacilli bacterium]|nr:rRNA pseudouridine synthase [Bacilli bacterium]